MSVRNFGTPRFSFYRVRSLRSAWEPFIIHCFCRPMRHLCIELGGRIVARDFGFKHYRSAPTMRCRLVDASRFRSGGKRHGVLLVCNCDGSIGWAFQRIAPPAAPSATPTGLRDALAPGVKPPKWDPVRAENTRGQVEQSPRAPVGFRPDTTKKHPCQTAIPLASKQNQLPALPCPRPKSL
jgi:hypothetical protein